MDDSMSKYGRLAQGLTGERVQWLAVSSSGVGSSRVDAGLEKVQITLIA